jgi:hypothetical protein
MAPPITFDPSLGDRTKCQLKTRIPVATKRALGAIALERGRPLTLEVEEALASHISRTRAKQAREFGKTATAV